MKGSMQIFHVDSHQFRESLQELLRELWFSQCSSREMPFREWNFAFPESLSEFRELLREYPGTLRELQEWPSHSESVFPAIWVVLRLLHKLKGPTRKPRHASTFSTHSDRQAVPEFHSGGCGCLGEGRLGVPGHIWESGLKNVWDNARRSQTSFFQTSAAF